MIASGPGGLTVESETVPATIRPATDPADGAEVTIEYGVRCFEAADPDAIRLFQGKFSSVQDACAYGDAKIGVFGITGYRLLRRECHMFPEGHRFAVAWTPWETAAGRDAS